MSEIESVKTIRFAHGNDTVRLYPIGDVHLGCVFCDERELKATVERIANDPDGYVILMGDMLDMVTRNSIGDIWSQSYTPWQQIDKAVEYLFPIRDKIIAATEGNHEERAFKFDGLLPIRQVVTGLHLDPSDVYAPCAGLIGVQLTLPDKRKANASVYFKHGFGGGRTIGAKANRMMEMKNEVIADVFLMAHTHENIAFPSAVNVPVFTSDGGVALAKKTSLHVNTNSFLRWGGYAVKQGYRPNITGCTPVTISAERKNTGTYTHAGVYVTT